MQIDVQLGGRDLGVSLAPALDAWTAAEPMTAALHSGDVGWHLRFDDEALEGAFRLWMVDGAPAAAGLVDGGVLRMAFAPDRVGDGDLAAAVAAGLEDIAYVETPCRGALRTKLLRSGWSADPDAWVLLYRELDAGNGAFEAPATDELTGEADVEARVAVQRSAFAPGSTFTAELWRRMAAGPSYDPRFELLTRTSEGEPAAAATGWFAGPGNCAILEPVGSHRDHQRQGYGHRVTCAVIAALARAGAGGVRVHTPAANRAALAAYEACGLRQVEWTTDVMAPKA